MKGEPEVEYILNIYRTCIISCILVIYRNCTSSVPSGHDQALLEFLKNRLYNPYSLYYWHVPCFFVTYECHRNA